MERSLGACLGRVGVSITKSPPLTALRKPIKELGCYTARLINFNLVEPFCDAD